MRYRTLRTLPAAGLLAVTVTGMTLAQAQQSTTPAPSVPAPAATAPAGTAPNMPSQMMEHGQGMGEMRSGMGPMSGQGHPGPMGGTPPCPPGQTASGTPPICK
jgi:hypothetical protein